MLSIKDKEVYTLARSLARETGENMTAAVRQALRERLERVRRRRPKTDELLAIGRRCTAALKAPPVDHGELLYDERGLPR